MMTFEYHSLLDDSIQTIKIDISMKKNLMKPAVQREIKAIYKDNILEKSVFNQHFISCIDLEEAVAEKIRACLTRIHPAIRDFFDVWYIKYHSEIDFQTQLLKELVEKKLADVEYACTINEETLEVVKKQIESDLKPVLSKEWLGFGPNELKEVYGLVLDFRQ
jgi:predicted nucleotidyltransferase component of viral defense system